MAGFSGTESNRIPEARDFSHERRLHRYVNTEDASQYDGIQWAAERYRSSILIEVSRETLPEYWDDFAIVIALPDGTNVLAQEKHYTLHDCLHKLDSVKFFIDGIDVGGQCEN